MVRKFLVSTVWIGLDYQWEISPEALPIIFETMVFDQEKDGGPLPYQERYISEEHAREGHEKVIQWVMKNLSCPREALAIAVAKKQEKL